MVEINILLEKIAKIEGTDILLKEGDIVTLNVSAAGE